MRNKERTIPEEAADKINDAVEDLTLKVAGTAVEPNAERVAAKVNEQVELPEISESASLPKHIDPTSSVRAARERRRSRQLESAFRRYHARRPVRESLAHG